MKFHIALYGSLMLQIVLVILSMFGVYFSATEGRPIMTVVWAGLLLFNGVFFLRSIDNLITYYSKC